MPRTALEILEEARQLPQADLDWLAGELYHLSSEDLAEEQHDAAWSTEIKRRIDAVRDGTAITYSLEEVEARLGLSLRTK